MKKIMILLLSLAVLFSFAACDNSSSEPAGDETPVGPNNADAFVAGQLDTYFQNIATRLAKTSGDDGAKVGSDEVSLTYTFVDTKAVGSTPAKLVTVTVKGTDVSADKDAAVRDVRLESYTMNAKDYKADGDASVLAYDVVNLTGKLQGSAKITKAVTIPTATPAAISSLTIDRVFAPTAVGSVSVTDANGTYAVDAEDFFAQMDAKCTGTDLDATYILESAYTTAMKAEYQTKLDAYVDAFAANLVGTYYNGLVGKSGVSVKYTPGTDASKTEVVFTYNVADTDPETDEKVLVGSENGTGVTVYLKEGSTLKVTFTAAANGVPTSGNFQPGTVKIDANVVVVDKTADTNVDGTSDLAIVGLTAAATASETITVTDYANAGNIDSTSAFTGIATALSTFTAGTASVKDATVAADVTVTSTETVNYAAN